MFEVRPLMVAVVVSNCQVLKLSETIKVVLSGLRGSLLQLSVTLLAVTLSTVRLLTGKTAGASVTVRLSICRLLSPPEANDWA